MASTKYTYTISTDFPNQAVATDKLQQEIGESTILVAIDYIATDATDCDVWFKSALTSPEEITMSGVVAAHGGQALSSSKSVALSEEYRDRSGKLRVQETSRPLGTKTCFTGGGDDPTDV